MKDSLAEKVREVEDEHAGQVLDTHLSKHGDALRMRAMFILGGVNIAGKVAASLGSEAIKALVKFQEEKMHEALGFETFVDFLGESEYSPMTKAQFYERKALLEKEGESLFDMLTELGMSIRRRKLLGQGNVELSGDVVIVKDGEEATEIALTDRARILETITALADANADKSKKLDKQKAKLDKHTEEKRELYEEIDRVKASAAVELVGDAHSMALANLVFAFAGLREATTDLSLIDKAARKDNVLEQIANQVNLTRSCYRTDGTEKPVEAGLAGETFDDQLTNFLDSVDLNDTNDAELAANL